MPNGQDYLGHTENAWSGRAGFIYRFGEIKKPTLISQKEKNNLLEKQKSMEKKLISFQMENDKMRFSNRELKKFISKQNYKLDVQNQRLEKLEKIALAIINDNNKTEANEVIKDDKFVASNSNNKKEKMFNKNKFNLFSNLRSLFVSSK